MASEEPATAARDSPIASLTEENISSAQEAYQKPLTFAEISALIESGQTDLIPNNKQIPVGTNVRLFCRLIIGDH